MSLPDPAALEDALAATWPPARAWRDGPWRMRNGLGGGKRVSATTLCGAFTADDIATAEQDSARRSESALFRVREGEDTLDAALADRGYSVVDPTVVYTAPAEALLNPDQRPLAAVASEARLGIQCDIWRAGGIGAERIAVMDRADGPSSWLLARIDDRAAGTGFVGLHGRIAMVHALETLARFRRRGAGRAMMHRAAKWALGQGASHLALAVTESNSPANTLYRALGMIPAARYHYRRQPEGRIP